ncbi:MCE family protein [bacterium]|nr:MCE family protein [bacterium]
MKQTKKTNKDIRVGAVIGFALIVIIATVFAVGGQRKMFGEKVRYSILFETTAGLYVGDPVLLTGVEVGNVSNVAFPQDIREKRIIVEVEVLKEVAPRIRKDTRAKIASASLVYGKVVTLSMGSMEAEILEPGSYITAEEGFDYSSVVSNTDTVITDIRSIVNKIEEGQGLAGLFLNGSPQIQATLANLTESSARLAGILSRLEKGESTAGAILSDSLAFRQTITEFQQSVADLRRITENLQGEKSVAGKIINDEAYGETVMADLQSTMHSLASITAKIDSGQGTLGSLINDKSIYYGLQDVVLGIENNKLAKWIVQNRRKAGEKERKKLEASESVQ